MAESFFFLILIDPTLKTETRISKLWNRALAHMNGPKKELTCFPPCFFSCFDIPGRKCGSARLGSVCYFTPIIYIISIYKYTGEITH